MKKGKLYIFIDNIEKYICIIALSVMLIVVFWQVVNRFVFNDANRWSEELARSLNVLVVYVSCSYGIRFRDHIKIDVMIKVFPKKIRPYLAFLGEALMLVFFIFLTIRGFQLAISVIAVGRVTSGMGIKVGYLYLLPPIGFALSSIRLAENWVDALILRFGPKKLDAVNENDVEGGGM